MWVWPTDLDFLCRATHWPNERRWEILMGEEVWLWKHTHMLQGVRLSEVTSYCVCVELTPSLIWSETGWPQRNAVPRWISEDPAAWLLLRFEVMGYEIYLCLECVCAYLSAIMRPWQRYRVRLFHLYNITDIELVFNPLNGFCILRDTDTWKHGGGTVSE